MEPYIKPGPNSCVRAYIGCLHTTYIFCILFMFLFHCLYVHVLLSSDSLMDFALTSVEGNGFTTTWRVPEGSGDFSYFQMYFTFFSSNNYRRSITVYPSDDRLNMTDDWYIFQFAGLHTLNSYEDYDQDSYGRGNGSFLITVVGYDGTGYWFSDDLMFTPGML